MEILLHIHVLALSGPLQDMEMFSQIVLIGSVFSCCMVLSLRELWTMVCSHQTTVKIPTKFNWWTNELLGLIREICVGSYMQEQKWIKEKSYHQSPPQLGWEFTKVGNMVLTAEIAAKLTGKHLFQAAYIIRPLSRLFSLFESVSQ